MAEDRLDLPAGYDKDAPPQDLITPADRGPDGDRLVNGLRALDNATVQIEKLNALRKSLIKDLLPLFRKPVMLTNSRGEPVIATASQARPMDCDAGELLAALIEFHDDEDLARTIWEECLKPPAVDTTAEGLLNQVASRHTEENPTVPPSVLAKVVREKPSSAFIAFPKPKPPKK
jgi:hypothetical protein